MIGRLKVDFQGRSGDKSRAVIGCYLWLHIIFGFHLFLLFFFLDSSLIQRCSAFTLKLYATAVRADSLFSAES